MAVIELTTQNFNEEVLQSDVPVMVDFWASWCGPCRMVSPIVDEIAEEVQGKAKVGKVNVDEQGDLASQFGVMSIPTIMVLSLIHIYFFTMNIIGNILRLQMKRRRCRNSHLPRNFSRFAFKWKRKEKVNDICSLKRLSEHLFIRSGKTKTLRCV